MLVVALDGFPAANDDTMWALLNTGENGRFAFVRVTQIPSIMLIFVNLVLVLKSLSYKNLFRIVLVLLSAYLAARAFMVDITNDEAYSFHNVKQFWYAEFLCTGNSHWFNSAFIWLCIKLHLTGVFFIRLLSLACGIAMLFILADIISTHIKNSFIQLLAFVMLCFNPYVLDHAILARGYVQAMFLQCLALWYLFGTKEDSRTRAFAFLFACASALAHFSFSYFLLGYTMIFMMKYEREDTSRWRFTMVPAFALTLTLVFLSIRFITRCSNDYVGAGEKDLNEAIMNSFTAFSYAPVPLAIGVALVLFLMISMIVGLWNRKGVFYYNSVLLASILVLVMASRYLLGNVFPDSRSALFLFIPGVLNLVLMLDLFHERVGKWNYLAVLLLVPFTVVFGKSINFSFVRDHALQSGTSEVVADMKSMGAEKILITAELHGVFANYYCLVDTALKCERLQKVWAGQADETYDHVVLFTSELPEFEKWKGEKPAIVKKYVEYPIVVVKN